MPVKSKRKNVVHMLRDTEIGLMPYPLKQSYNIMDSLIRNKTASYELVLKENYNKFSTYTDGILFMNDFKTAYTTRGVGCKPTEWYKTTQIASKKKISDSLTCATPDLQDYQPKNSTYNYSHFVGFLLYIADDHWLCRSNLWTGESMQDIFIRPRNTQTKFKFCDWNGYPKQIVLTSAKTFGMKQDVMCSMAVFSVCPFEFKCLFDVKRSVFGKCCNACVNDKILMLGKRHGYVHMYDFSEVLKKGKLTPLKIGDEISPGEIIGSYPTGLVHNLSIDDTPPLLFNIRSPGWAISFGGHPYLCLYKYMDQVSQGYRLQEMFKPNNPPITIETGNDPRSSVAFHEDRSNRIVETTSRVVTVHKIVHNSDHAELQKNFTMDFRTFRPEAPQYSSRGRKLAVCTVPHRYIDGPIWSMSYEKNLEMIAILGTETEGEGYIRIYDNLTGKFIKTVYLGKGFSNCCSYDFFFDVEQFVILQQPAYRDTRTAAARVYQLCREGDEELCDGE